MWRAYEDRDAKAIKDIEYAKSLYELQGYNVKRELHIEKLLLEDYVRTIKSYTSRYDVFESDIFQKAQSQMSEKLKKDRPQLEMMKSLIISDFLNNDKNWKLVSITSCGWESHSWSFGFKGYDKTIYIEIPHKRKLTVENFEYAHHGMFSFYVKDGEHCRRFIKESYRIEDIAEAIKECLGL